LWGGIAVEVLGAFKVAEPEGRGVDYVPGLRCYKLGRLIASGEFFGHPNAVQVSGMARLVGEIDLSPVPLTMNKSDFARDGAEWVAVERRMHALLAPIARRLAEDELAPPPASALKTAEQVRCLLSQVLKLAEREEMFQGLAATRSRRRTGRWSTDATRSKPRAFEGRLGCRRRTSRSAAASARSSCVPSTVPFAARQ
jgi:hypothetical protein